ncbi:hypothetical protein [Kineococcus rubinsiae]|uniref:hypothetical protein n=1 Tax=Kineococcus rubinsiae TaxID=2609562 RepID=UPI0014301E03|nr:hypothetical protein [Kineococcus rubinsiae]NIZ92452.1 hypothetical protein [Kineococcus rubinsiae]
MLRVPTPVLRLRRPPAPPAARPTAAAPATPAPVDPALAVYLNEHLAAAGSLAADLRRAARSEELGAERDALLRLRREVAADRAALRAVMRDLGIGTDWAVLGLTWASARVGQLAPLLQRLPVLDRVPAAAAPRRSAVQVLLDLEALEASLRRREAVWRVLGDRAAAHPQLRAAAFGELLERSARQAGELHAAHARLAAALFGGSAQAS